MFKKIVFTLWIGCLVQSSYAQVAGFSTIGPAKTQPPAPGTSKVLTPQEFQDKVKDMGQQNQDQVQQQASQLLLKLMPQQDSSNKSKPVSAPTQPIDNNPFPDDASASTPASVPAAVSQPKSSGPVEQILPETKPSNQQAAPESAPAPQSQGYTGFGGGANVPSQPASQSSGGWSIKY